MSKVDKLIDKLLSGHSDNNYDFDDLRKVIEHFGFNEEIIILIELKITMHSSKFNH